MSKLALLGGEKSVTIDEPQEMFDWPIINKAMEDATLKILRERTASGIDISKEFERGFAD